MRGWGPQGELASQYLAVIWKQIASTLHAWTTAEACFGGQGALGPERRLGLPANQPAKSLPIMQRTCPCYCGKIP
jgi:hypothetical protein